MTTHDATRRGGIPPITVRPGLAVSVAVVTVLLAAITLPATVPDRPGFAYLSGGLIGAGLLIGILLGADLRRARAARRAGLTVVGITVGAFGSRLTVALGDRGRGSAGLAGAGVTHAGHPAAGSAAPTDRRSGSTGSPATFGAGGGVDIRPPAAGPRDPAGGSRFAESGAEVRAEAKVARAGLTVTTLAGALLVTLGALAPAGTLALAGQVALWVGTFALLVTFIDALPSPRSSGGRLIAARVLRRTGSRERAEQAVARAGVISGWSLIAVGAASVFAVGFVGLWAVLLGWLALGASRLAQSQQRTYAALAGLVARDVMSPAPPMLSSWSTVDDALDDVVLPARRALFGVEDFDGSLAGVALLRDLAAVPMDDRGLARVNRVLVPLSMVATAAPDDAVADLPARLLERPAAGCVVVVEPAADGSPRMVGTVGPVEFGQAIETAPLRGRGAGPVRPGSLWR
ncbi:peptidase M50 [Candidatus Frankia alpina]|uniref:peptidase M50 n=1 Tax=Candidatus Frankia alpina TaxID=2699483 RepID=UPI0013D47FD6|nr:peptidase M50 [Candidatus Frankia alpina]